ncbi:MAG TPA: ferrous iron transport protein B, partial [Anaerolineales bacterium]|nr:ferrous iron transport protein B [Anaerolineales bacterium]
MSDCHSTSLAAEPVILRQRMPLLALAGQPNVGKSTLFNFLTGLNQHVGNWPGKTVERKEGSFSINGKEYGIVDLPGTYSLTANSPEEIITREFILREQPDLVIAIVNAANLERSLYLVAELISLSTPLAIILNMMDVARQEGISVEPQVLEAALGVPVIPMTATRPTGMRVFYQTVQEMLESRRVATPRLPEIRADHRAILNEILNQIQGLVPPPYPESWVALKLLEGDVEITHMMQGSLPAATREAIHNLLRQHDDALLAIASGRYEWIGRMIRAAVVQPKIGQISLTKQLDHWTVHPLWGLVILAGILGLVFWLTFTIGSPIQGWLDSQILVGLTGIATRLLAHAPFWIRSLLVDGVIGGVGAVVTFLPIMIIFFAVFGLLEDMGYMARAAFVMDNFMHMMGLHGKYFLPLFLGFGCNVPSILGTRVIDSKPARLLTILIAPLVPCTARMAVVAFLAPVFFGSNAIIVAWCLV